MGSNPLDTRPTFRQNAKVGLRPTSMHVDDVQYSSKSLVLMLGAFLINAHGETCIMFYALSPNYSFILESFLLKGLLKIKPKLK